MEHIALYRQFRPMTFDEIVEQKHAVTSLRKAVTSGRIGHAYLFCGQRGTGKTSIARVFSRAINCESPENGNPCNKCPTCKGILDGTLMDVIEIDAASNTSVDNIRKISEEVGFAPSRAPHKVYIIDEVHMISSGAFNALLKTLEEPPAHAVFLFATTEPHRIPATVLSRCQRYDFRRISPDAISGRLRYICDQEKIDASDDALRLIASLSDGAMRDAISVLDQAATASDGKKITAESIEEITGTVDTSFMAKMTTVLIEGKFDELLPLIQQLAESGRDIIRFSLDLAQYMRNLLVIRVVPDPSSLIPASISTLKEMYEIADKASPETFAAFISYLSGMISELKWSPSVRTSFEISMIRLCGRKAKADVVPLTMPDFAAMQAKAAASMSDKKPEPVKADKPSAKAEEKAEEKKTEPGKEDKPESAKSSDPVKTDDKKDTLGILGLLKKLDTAPKAEEKPEEKATPKEEPVKDETPAPVAEAFAPEEEPAPAPEAQAAAAPAAKPETEEDPDDKPLENQLDLFSLASGSDTSSDADDKKDKPEAKAPSSATGLFAEDLMMPYDRQDAPEVKVPDPAPAPEPEPEQEEEPGEPLRSWENKQTSLASALANTEIVHIRPAPEPVPEPEEYYGADTDTVWSAVNARIREDDFVLWSMLSEAQFRVVGDGGYIVFEDKNKGLIKQITDDTNYRKVSYDIKSALREVEHVYLCTETQYSNALRTGGGLAKAKSVSKTDELINRTKQMGIETEIHFGDD